MVKQIHNLVLTRSHAKEAFGFRIIGGKEQGLTFKVRRLGMILEKSIAKIFGHPIVSFVRQMAKYRKCCFILHCLNSGCGLCHCVCVCTHAHAHAHGDCNSQSALTGRGFCIAMSQSIWQSLM